MHLTWLKVLRYTTNKQQYGTAISVKHSLGVSKLATWFVLQYMYHEALGSPAYLNTTTAMGVTVPDTSEMIKK